MNTTDLHPYPDNPRVHGDGAGLHKSIMELGDLSGVVFNIQNNCLVGGHYRSKTIPKDSIIESHPVSDPTGTVAEGTIILPTGQRLNYREVDWDEDRHKLACIEANNQKIQGEWDAGLLEPLLADLNVDLPEGDFEDFGLDELAEEFGFSEEEREEQTESFQGLDQAIQLKPPREYIVIMCEDDESGQEEFEQLKEMFNLKLVRRGGYKEGSPMESVGTQRVVKARDLFNMVSG